MTARRARDFVLAGGWVTILLVTVLFGLCASGCTEPNPDFAPLQGPIRQPGDPGTVPGSPDGGAASDSGTAPDVTAPKPDTGGGAADALGDAGGGTLPGCKPIVTSCAGQPRGTWCRAAATCSGTAAVIAGGVCDGNGACDYGFVVECAPGQRCAAGSCAQPSPCGPGNTCHAGSVCIEGVCRSCGGGM